MDTQNQGMFFEDFYIGQQIKHGVPRTITDADCSMYLALTGSRFALHCAEPVATRVGFRTTPVDNFLLFNIAFGKTVNDVSRNAVANLGYAEVQFFTTVYPDDTIYVCSEVIGKKANSNGKTGVVYVHSKAYNQRQQLVLQFKRWVMINKRDPFANDSSDSVPDLQSEVEASSQLIPHCMNLSRWQDYVSDNQLRASQLNVGDSIFHQDGVTLNDSDHSMATRLYQNNARVHFDQHLMQSQKHGKRLVYGGHVISVCRSLSYNGLANGLYLTAIHSGKHTNPSFAGDTIYAQSNIIAIDQYSDRDDLSLVKVQLLGFKNNHPTTMSYIQDSDSGRYHQDVILDMELSYLMPK
ncbi:MaoC family dehydratase [Thalassotalea sp. Y01]|uniref:MaoC family dehydratase n=1 Tax=Thalassotalea sp. Y01 TaxID=2729613 RepID=UPI00145CB65E|nr:MaoC family dehydratase [Thalassotalea sp. Y01]NMP16962.1 MaoC family dehydratase [Thalassotalea sp. Y01]